MKEKIVKYLTNLGFDHSRDFSGSAYLSSKIGTNSFFSYQVKSLATTIYFIYLPPTDFDNKLFEAHQLIWNDNKTEAFIIIGDEKTLLCSAKYKPLKKIHYFVP